MSGTSPNSSLDNFIRDVLKNPDSDLEPIDWSEIDVLLRHEHKSISFLENKKLLLIIGGFAIFLILAFGVFKLIQYYSSLPVETQKIVVPVQNQIKKITDSSASVIKTAKIGSSFVNEDDDTSSDISIAKADTPLIKKVVPTMKPIQKQEKNKKQDTVLSAVDTSTKKTKTEELSPLDTTSKHPIQETKNDAVSFSDTTRRKFLFWPKRPKK